MSDEEDFEKKLKRLKITTAALRAEGRRMRAEGIESRSIEIDGKGTWATLTVGPLPGGVVRGGGVSKKVKASKKGPVKR